jgi:hypothetical protein
MNKAFRKYLTSSEIELIELTKPVNLKELDEDALAELHNRVRRARSKYSKLHRREASSQVRRDGSRAKAAAKNPRSAVKAEVFEDALARVSRALAAAAKASAAELKAERLAAAAAGSGGPKVTAKSAPRAAAKKKATARGKGSVASKRTPATRKKVASTRAVGARRQAKRDSR